MAHLEFQVDSKKEKSRSAQKLKSEGRSLLAWETLLEGIERTEELRYQYWFSCEL